MNKSDINQVKLGGARRKNGHKSNCTCHICENMKSKARRGGYEDDMEREQEKMNGGSKKKNGHRANCMCPICKNMRHAKKGGDGDDMEEPMTPEKDNMEESPETPVQEAGKRKRSNGHKANCLCPICKNMRKGRGKRGGDEPDIENQMGDIEEAGIKGSTESSASDADYDELDAAERGEASRGGKSRRRHSFRKSRKLRRTRRRHRSHRRH